LILLEAIGAFLILVGIFCAIVGSLGILRLPDVFNRAHAATVCVMGGVVVSIFGSALTVEGLEAAYTVKALLIAGVIFFTSPIGSHAMIRAAYKSGVSLWRGTVCDKLKEEGGLKDA